MSPLRLDIKEAYAMPLIHFLFILFFDKICPRPILWRSSCYFHLQLFLSGNDLTFKRKERFYGNFIDRQIPECPT